MTKTNGSAWLDSPATADIADYEDFARRVKGQNFSDAVGVGHGRVESRP